MNSHVALYLADVIARYHRLAGDNVFFLTGVDQHGQKLKAAGTFDIEAFDLAADPSQSLVGKWHLDLAQADASWNSTLLEYTYGFILRMPKPPLCGERSKRVSCDSFSATM